MICIKYSRPPTKDGLFSSIFSDKEGLMRHHRQVKLAKAWLICKMLFPSFATMQGIRKKEAAACGIMLTLFATFSSTKVLHRVLELRSSAPQFSRVSHALKQKSREAHLH